MTKLGVLENLLSDFLFILILLSAGWIWMRFTRRRDLHRFFGVSSTKRLAVYLSNIRVLTFGAVGLSGQKMSYQGTSVAHGEMLAANQLRDLFSFVLPTATEAPTFISKLFFSDVLVQVLVSPLDLSELESEAPIITLGSPAYNLASAIAERAAHNGASFRVGVLKKDDVAQAPPGETGVVAGSTDTEVYYTGITGSYPPSGLLFPELLPVESEELPSAILVNGVGDITDSSYGFVQRAHEADSRRFLFYVAGLSEAATAAAAHYLYSQWRNLSRKYRSEIPFLVMLKFEPPDFRKWSVVFERELKTAG